MPKTPPSQSPQERIQKGLEELKRRAIKSDNCPRCNSSGMNVDLIEISARSAVAVPSGQLFPRSATYDQAGGFVPLLAFVCKNCGFSMFHDLNILGV
jgi:predicted Zn-ribbon and HTH transcriptional regulator